jgi:enamine deaminase RidA (YjgF/YER057c/UK114 family)
MTEHANLGSGAPWEARVGYSRVVRRGPAVWVSGTVAMDGQGRPMTEASAEAQARRCLEIIVAALERVGASRADVVRTRMYVVDIRDWQAVGRAHGAFFGDVRPATSLVEVSGLIEKGFRVEIEAEAWVGTDGVGR